MYFVHFQNYKNIKYNFISLKKQKKKIKYLKKN